MVGPLWLQQLLQFRKLLSTPPTGGSRRKLFSKPHRKLLSTPATDGICSKIFSQPLRKLRGPPLTRVLRKSSHLLRLRLPLLVLGRLLEGPLLLARKLIWPSAHLVGRPLPLLLRQLALRLSVRLVGSALLLLRLLLLRLLLP